MNPNTTIDNFELPIDRVLNYFKTHIKSEGNYRIFFSGKFGTGKTYFLHKFFETYKSTFEVIRISPTAYSTSDSRDIYELIKFDILTQLMFHNDLKENKSFENSVFSKLFAFQFYLLNGFTKEVSSNAELFSPFINQFSGIGASVFGVLAGLRKVYSGFDSYYQNLKKETDRSILDDYMEKMVEERGNPYEFDLISDIIKDSLAQIKTKTKKKIVLEIDDLDRLDPDHIFRILNVFANHLEFKQSPILQAENKFGFDHVIIVGDFKNIKSVFSHRYGKEADFEGYISKFYSKSIFSFNIQELLDDDLKKIILRLNFPMLLNSEKQPEIFIDSLYFHLRPFILSNLLSIRDIEKGLHENYQIYINHFRASYVMEKSEDFYSYPSIYLLYELYGRNKEALLQAIDQIDKSFYVSSDTVSSTVFMEYLMILTESDHRYYSGSHTSKIKLSESSPLTFEYEIRGSPWKQPSIYPNTVNSEPYDNNENVSFPFKPAVKILADKFIEKFEEFLIDKANDV